MGTIILKLVIAVAMGLFTAGVLYCGYSYIQEVKEDVASKAVENNFNKQQFVKEKRHIFGINDVECGYMNKIYTVSPKEMGL